MNKNVKMPVILRSKLTMDSLLLTFGAGSEIVFIVDNDKLFGGITQGDFKRALKNGIDDITIEIINTGIKHIVLSNESDCIKKADFEAKRIFDCNNRINTIPVVDDNGGLCFQYERKKNGLQNQIINMLCQSDSDAVLEAFFECYANLNIVITGADDKSLAVARKIFLKRLEKMEKKTDVSVCNIMECSILGAENVIITLTDFCTIYLKEHTTCSAKVVPLAMLPGYKVYPQIDKLTVEVLQTWKRVFGYEEAVLLMENSYTYSLKFLMEQCGIVFRTFSSSNTRKLNQYDDGIHFQFYSDCGRYSEAISTGRLVEIIQLLADFKNVSGQNYSTEFFVEDFKECFRTIQKRWGGTLYFEIFNKLDATVKENVIGEGIHVVNPEQQNIENVNINVKDARSVLAADGIYAFDFVYECIQYSINKVIYNKLTKLCRKVYRLNNRSLNEINYTEYPEQTRMNFFKEEYGMFPENFVEDLYGDKSYPVKELLNDIAGCKLEEICEGYIKYQSNYSSKYFNTDIYGDRITTDAPEKYEGSIYLLGRCMMSGYAVCDHDTTASYLQRLLNENNFCYRIVNLAIDNGEHQYTYKKIMERDIKGSDIIVMQFPWADIEDPCTIYFDYKQIADKADIGKRFYWDVICHCSNKGYELIADCIFEHIRHDLMHGERVLFRLDKELEIKVMNYIVETKNKISFYSNLKQDGGKIGAIVMNCNPFTYGHLYLVETASCLVDILYIFVVQENKSIFSFQERLKMVKEGVKRIDNVVVISGGGFMISSVTFPGYFMKEDPENASYDSYLDLKIFLHYIVPAFNISIRFVGTEPFDAVTAKYNQDMQIILGEAGVQVIEVPRKRLGEKFISATVVRKMLKEDEWEGVESFVPDSTYKLLKQKMKESEGLKTWK